MVERHTRGPLLDVVGHLLVEGGRLGVEELARVPCPPFADEAGLPQYLAVLVFDALRDDRRLLSKAIPFMCL